MTTEGLINICQAVKHGSIRRVRNARTDQQGTVTGVEGNFLTVLTGNAQETWGYEDCIET